MKAVILAGGEGSRLRPITLERPKPLLPLLDGTVLSRCLENLLRARICDVTLALGHQADTLEAWCAQHTPTGMTLRCRREERPMGTAGAVRALLPELGEEDFLVLPGDVVWQFDLQELIAYHRASRNLATVALASREGGPGYGMVVADDTGRIERFVEKPAWDQVVSATVNTGIYVLTRRAADKIPLCSEADFARDLFPLLLEQGEPVGGHVIDGYWRDVGSARRYVDCVSELLEGKDGGTPSAPKVAPGVWSQVPLPPGVQVVPPCWFAEGVTLEEGARIGPHVALGRGAFVGKRALVQRSVLMNGARVEDRATLYGAVLCPHAVAQRESVLNEGSVLADRARAGEHAVLSEDAAVWPDLSLPAGTRLNTALRQPGEEPGIRFGDGGVLRGIIGETLKPETFTAIGVLLGGEGKVALGWSGGDGAVMLSRALSAGICAGGGTVLTHDGCCAAASAWLGSYYGLPSSLFVEQEGERVFLHWFDANGLPPTPERISRLERRLRTGECKTVRAGQVGCCERLRAVNTAYIADAARRVAKPMPGSVPILSVPGDSRWDQALADLLERIGCRVLRHPAPNVACFSSAYGGLRLQGRQEGGTAVTPEQFLALVALLELEAGNAVAVPANAPAVIEELGAATGKPVLRLGRDKGAEELYAASPWLRDALFAAGYLAVAMGSWGQSLAQLISRLPSFELCRREIPLQRGRGELMQAFTGHFRRAEPAGKGVRLPVGTGWVYVAPMIRRRAVQLQTEDERAEVAEELCAFYEEEILRLDQGK